MVLALLCVYVIIPAIRYNMAVTAVENKNYDEAIAIFEELGDYSDSADKIPETKMCIRDRGNRRSDAVPLRSIFYQ